MENILATFLTNYFTEQGTLLSYPFQFLSLFSNFFSKNMYYTVLKSFFVIILVHSYALNCENVVR